MVFLLGVAPSCPLPSLIGSAKVGQVLRTSSFTAEGDSLDLETQTMPMPSDVADISS